MSIHIAKGNLGLQLLDVVAEFPNRVNFTSKRLNQLPLEVVAQIGIPDSLEQKTEQVRIATELADTYLPKDLAPRDIFRIEERLMFLQSIIVRGFGSVEKVCDKVVLDLACGSRVRYEDPDTDRIVNYLHVQPWMCRLVHHLGGHAIGVDIRPQDNEEFEWYQVDLLNDSALDCLGDAIADAYYCANFRAPLVRPRDPSESAEWDVYDTLLGPQLLRVLKPDALVLTRYQPGFAEYRDAIG